MNTTRPDLQYDPVSVLGSDVHGFLGHDLLTLTQRDVVEVVVVGRKAELLTELLDVLEWVDAWRQDEEDRSCRSGLLVRLGEFHAATFHVLGAQFFFDECSAAGRQQPFTCQTQCLLPRDSGLGLASLLVGFCFLVVFFVLLFYHHVW